MAKWTKNKLKQKQRKPLDSNRPNDFLVFKLADPNVKLRVALVVR